MAAVTILDGPKHSQFLRSSLLDCFFIGLLNSLTGRTCKCASFVLGMFSGNSKLTLEGNSCRKLEAEGLHGLHRNSIALIGLSGVSISSSIWGAKAFFVVVKCSRPLVEYKYSGLPVGRWYEGGDLCWVISEAPFVLNSSAGSSMSRTSYFTCELWSEKAEEWAKVFYYYNNWIFIKDYILGGAVCEIVTAAPIKTPTQSPPVCEYWIWHRPWDSESCSGRSRWMLSARNLKDCQCMQVQAQAQLLSSYFF